MKINANRLLSMLLLCLSLCLALGGAWAEEMCTGGAEHDIGHEVLNNGSGLVQYCRNDCGHEAYIYLNPYEFVIGQDKYDVSITRSGSTFLGPEIDPPVFTQRKPGPNDNLKSMSIDLAQVTTPGQYYYAIKIERYALSGMVNLITADHKHNIVFSAPNNSDTITAYCNAGNCQRNGTLTLSVDFDSDTFVSVTTSDLWPEDAQVSSISYTDANGNPVSGIPFEEGDYTASVSVGGATASASFTLTETIITPQQLPADRIVSNAPYGMAFSKQDIAAGQYHVTVSKKNTDWNAIIAQLYDTQRAMTIWQTPHVVPYEGSTDFAYVSLSAEELATDPDAIKKAVDKLQAQHKENNIPGNRTLSMRNIGGYTPENGLFEPYMDDEKFLDVLGWYKNGKLFAVELLSTMVDIDDKSSFTITADTLPAENILPATNLSGSALDAMEYAVNAGAVSYRADSRDAVNASTIETTVILPQTIAGKAATCEISYDVFKNPIIAQVETIGGKPAVRIASDIPANNSASGYSYSLIFKDAQGVYVKAYALTVTLRTGEPVPFPLYHSDWEAIPASRLTLQVSNTSGAAVPSGLGLSYNERLGIVNYDIDSDKLPRNQALDTVYGSVRITAPEDAKAYRMYPPFEGGLSIRPDMYSITNDDSLHAEERLLAESPMTGISGGAFGRPIEYPFLQGHDVKLGDQSYVLYDLGLPNMGELGAGLRLIFWYDDMNADQPFKKEYVLVTHDPASAPKWTTLVTSESALASQNAALPRMRISGTMPSGETYLFYSELVPQTAETTLHYELYLTDKNGNPVSKETLAALAPYTVYIPVPDGVDADDPSLSFSISHLNTGSTAVKETFSYEDGTLVLTQYGLCFTVDSFSPFVLSWSNAAVDTSALPQTGDHSPAMPMLLMALTLSLGFITLSLRKKQA